MDETNVNNNEDAKLMQAIFYKQKNKAINNEDVISMYTYLNTMLKNNQIEIYNDAIKKDCPKLFYNEHRKTIYFTYGWIGDFCACGPFRVETLVKLLMALKFRETLIPGKGRIISFKVQDFDEYLIRRLEFQIIDRYDEK